MQNGCALTCIVALDAILKPVCAYFNATSSGELPKPSCSAPATTPKPSACHKKTSSTGWKAPLTTSSAPSYNATPKPPAQFYGAASNMHVVGSSMLVAVGAFAAMML